LRDVPEVKKITIHLGAHKTGSTHLQSRLEKSQYILNPNGISYIPLNTFREKFKKFKNNSEPLIQSLKSYMNSQHVLISDEQILGNMLGLYNGTYPLVKRNLQSLLAEFKGINIEFHLTIRNYEDFFISSYFEFLRQQEYINFTRFFRNINRIGFSWVDLVNEINSAGAENLIISEYKNIFENEDLYLYTLLGRTDLSLEKADSKPSIRRSRLSKEGYDVLNYVARKYSPLATKSAMWALDSCTQSTSSNRFNPFSVDQSVLLSQQYIADLEALKEKITYFKHASSE